MTARPKPGELKQSGNGQTSCMAARELWGAGFSRDQLRKLARDVDPRHIQNREVEGRQLSYIEGWYAVAQANAIFGYAGWDREMVHFERVMERTKNEALTCAYIARVRIRVRAGSTEIIREGTGWGSASGRTSTSVHERALKAAETDATKRALTTFGPGFGLRLYDKEHSTKVWPRFSLFAPDGKLLDDNLSPEGFSTGCRQFIDVCGDRHQVDQLQRYNAATLADLRIKVPTLRNVEGVHFADLLLRLMQRRRERLAVANGVERKAEANSVAVAATGSPPVKIATAPGEAFRRYTGQSSRRRSPYPFPPRKGQAEGESPSRAFSLPGNAAAPPRSPGSREASGSKAIAVPSQAGIAAQQLPKPDVLEERSVNTAATNGVNATHNGASAVATASLPVAVISENNQTTSSPVAAQMLPPSRITNGLRIDKSGLWLALERRLRDKGHLKRVSELPCVVCNRQPSHAHHLRFAQRRGMSQKVSDEYVVPLCALHHGDLHRSSSEQDWWDRQKIDPLPISSELWLKHHA